MQDLNGKKTKKMKYKIVSFLFFSIVLIISCKQLSKDAEQESSFGKQQVSSIEISNLYDAFGKSEHDLIKDFGFSTLIKYNGKTILFDAGSDADIFKNNISALGINLTDVDLVVLSHAHMDHMNGIDYLLKLNPNVKIYLPKDALNFGPFPMNVKGMEESVSDSLPIHMQYFDGKKKEFFIEHSGRYWGANIEIVEENKEIFPGAKLIATESPYVGYCFSYPNNDFLLHEKEDNNDKTKHINLKELSLSLESNKEEILIVGCSHSTVQKIVEETINYTEREILLLYGGYHLIPFDRDYLNSLGDYLKNELKVKKVAPAHCTGHLAFKILKNIYDENYLYAGLGEKIFIKN